MPWHAADADRHKKGLNPKQKEAWAEIANRVLADCMKSRGDKKFCEGKAIRIANAKSVLVGKRHIG